MVRSFLFFSYCIFYGVNAEHYSNNEEDQWDSGTLAYGFAYESDITTVYETINESTEQNDRSTIPDETESSSSIKDELLLPDKKCTGPNEMYIPNKKKCPPEVCSSIVSRYACDPKEKGQPGCVCKSSFLRMNLTSTCMPIKQCPELINSQEPECNKPNESLKCVKICPPARTCQNRNVFYRCANNVNEVCKNKCVCYDGFYRNPDGFCVTKDLCDKKCTGPNEMYTPIKKKCPPEVCRSIVSRYACDPNEEGQPGCVCESGFLRMNLTSTCMPIKQCPELINSQEPECNKPNESLQCVKACPPARTCQNRNVSYKCANNMDEVCKNKCVCNDGFYRNPDGFCVTSDLCDEKCSGPNEMYDPNKKSCPPQICQSILALYKCDSKEQGQPGCVCKPGFLRMNLNSTCIPVDQCPEFKDSPDFTTSTWEDVTT